MSALDEAGPSDISFLSNPRYAAALAASGAGAVLVNADWSGESPCPVIRVPRADVAFMQVSAWLGPPALVYPSGVHASAFVADDVQLGADVSIGPHCVILPGARIGARTVLVASVVVGHEAAIGEDCLLHPLASLRERVSLGDRVIVHNGAVIGSDGFGYYEEGEAWRKIPQVGTVRVGDDVEIGANTTIDRARFDATVIEDGVKLDNLVHLAHNVHVGAYSAMAAHVGISGSARIGRHVQFGGQSGCGGHLEVGDYTVVAGAAGVTKSIPPRSFVSGFPAMPHSKARKAHAHMMRIPELKARLKALEQTVRQLEAKVGSSGA